MGDRPRCGGSSASAPGEAEVQGGPADADGGTGTQGMNEYQLELDSYPGTMAVVEI